MPEGHSLHRLARDLQELVGRSVQASSPQGKFDEGAAAVNGHKLEVADAYGKHLLLTFSTGDTVHIHLGMGGKFLRFANPEGPPLRQVRLRLQTDDVAWDLIAPSACDLLDSAAVETLTSRLGPDPLRADADKETALNNIRTFPGTIGAALMEQDVIAGVGNVFRAEVLHACRVAPKRAANRITDDEAECLWSNLQQMMSRGIEDGRIITVDATDEERASLPEENTRRVYKQERCYDCSTAIVTETINGRTSYHCPNCQPD